MEKITFKEFCYNYCDRLYNPELPDDMQCTGYNQLKKMVVENITPASLEEIKRWETNPTKEELFTVPDIKYLRFLHPLLRPVIIEHWKIIKHLNIS